MIGAPSLHLPRLDMFRAHCYENEIEQARIFSAYGVVVGTAISVPLNWRRSSAIWRAITAFVSTTSGEPSFAIPTQARRKSPLSMITRGKEVTYRIDREPTGPGEILQGEFLCPLGLTQKQLSDHIGCDVEVISRIVNGRASVGAEMAVKLAASLGTSPQFWLNAQQAVDIYHAEKNLKERPARVIPPR